MATEGTHLLANLLDDVAEHGEEALEEVGQVVEHVDERHRVEDGDPAHQQLPDVPGLRHNTQRNRCLLLTVAVVLVLVLVVRVVILAAGIRAAPIFGGVSFCIRGVMLLSGAVVRRRMPHSQNQAVQQQQQQQQQQQLQQRPSNAISANKNAAGSRTGW